MNYARLIGEAWRLTWHYRFLWVLGLFAGGALGSGWFGGSFQWRGGRREADQLPPAVGAAAEAAARLLAANVGLVVGIAVLVAVVGLALLVVSLVARGAVVRAAADLELGRSSSLRLAWHAGEHLFWRYVRLILVLAALGFAVALALGVLAVFYFMPAAAVGPGPTARPLWILVAVVVLAIIVGAVPLSIVVAYAQRAIALDDVGAVESLRLGWRTLREHVGESLLAWVVSIALGVVAGIALLGALLAAVAVVGGVGFGVWVLVGVHPVTVVYAVLAGLAVLAVGATLAAIANTFFWTYWTLAYMQLRGGPMGPAARPVGP